VLLDLAFDEPANPWHPVAWLGNAAGRLERAGPTDGRRLRLAYGAVLVALLGGGSAAAGYGLSRALAPWPLASRLPLAAAILKSTFSLRGLATTAGRIGRQLEDDALPEARSELRALVSRPADDLDASQAASAAIESVAENLSDSVLAPIFYYLALGLPGALAYRAVNTLDAMIGYHGDYEELGKCAALCDDLANLLPARSSALLLVAAAWLGFGDGRAAWGTMWRDHARTESPNAGWPMSAAAGALRVRLEKRGHYRLGRCFPTPTPKDIDRAIRLYYASAALGIGVAANAVSLWEKATRLVPSPFGRGSG
jgi:adenosylcobinamide-phosphate synthase